MGPFARAAGLGFVAAAVLTTGVAAQSLGDRVGAVEHGWAVLRFDVDEEVEVCDSGLRRVNAEGETRMRWHWDSDDEGDCGPGPLQLEMEVVAGRIVHMRMRRPRSLAGSTDLGHVEAQSASDYLVSLAYRDVTREVAEHGFALALLPRGSDPAPGMIRAARDRGLDTPVRRSAIFWSGQLAADEVVTGLADVARDAGAEQGVRDAAVFALSQNQDERALPALMDLAMTAPQAETRRSALFWLAQHDDGRVVDFLADIILDRGGG